MYIESLHVNNIGPFDLLDVEFNPHMNVIVGVNGVGKTSMLRCIAYCLTNLGMEGIRMRKDAMLKLFCSNNEKKYVFGADQLVDKNQDYRSFTADKWNLTVPEGYEGKMIYEDNKDYSLLAIGAYRFFSYKKLPGMMREALRSERRKYYQKSNPAFLESMEMPDIKQWMINRYFQIDKDWAVTEKKNWDNIIEKLCVIAPRETKFKFVRIERDLEPIFSFNGRECYLEELSSGFKSILSIVFIIIDWIEGVNEGKDALIENAEGTVMIDEIDAHLHPSWQTTVLDSLQTIFPKLQFIVTTHSPSVLMSAKSGEVILFTNDNGVVDLKPVGNSYGAWQISDVLSDVMQAPEMDRVSINNLMEVLDEAFVKKQIELFRSKFQELETVLSPSDSILKIYKIKLAQLLLL